MKIKKMLKQIYSCSNIIVVDGYGNELFKGFVYELFQKVLMNKFDNYKLIRIKEEYDNNTNAAFIKIYVK